MFETNQDISLIDETLLEKNTPTETINERQARQYPNANDFLLSANLREKNELDETNELYFLYGAEHLSLKHLYFDIPVAYKDAVIRWITFFQSRGVEYFRRYLARAGRYAPLLTKILKDQGLPQDLVYLAMAESGFHAKAISRASAVGAWQFMPYTGRKFGLEIDFFKDERMDPIKATIAAGQYLGQLYKEFGSWELAAAAYNAGEGKIRKAIKRYQTKNFWELRKKSFLRPETREYVPKIMALAILSKNLESFGITDVEFYGPLDFDTIEVSPMTDLYEVSDALDVPFDELQSLNPELLRWMSPADQSSYPLRVPVGKSELWRNCCAQQEQQFKAQSFQTHTIGENTKANSLENLARTYKIGSHVLSTLNNISPHKKLAAGTKILLPFRINHSSDDSMYQDLYKKTSRRELRQIRKRKVHTAQLDRIEKRNEELKKTIYVVKKGDTLWGVSRKTGVALDAIIKSNLTLVSAREIKPGDRLILQ